MIHSNSTIALILSVASLLTPSVRAATFDLEIQRSYLDTLAHEPERRRPVEPARRLVQPLDIEGISKPGRSAELVESTLAMTTDLAARFGRSLVDTQRAIDLVLAPELLMVRASNGSLSGATVNPYTEELHEAVIDRLRVDRVAFWLTLMREHRHADVRAAVLNAIGVFDRAATPSGGLEFGFTDLRWHSRSIADRDLVDFARAHVRKIVELRGARRAIEKLGPSRLRERTLEALDAVANDLKIQLHDLPALSKTLDVASTTNRKRQQQQSRATPIWDRLGAEESDRGAAAWAHTLTDLAHEIRLDVSALRPECRSRLSD